MAFYAAADGTRLHYRLAGSGRPALLFIHGWCGNVGHWDPQARALSRTHRVLRVDRRGDGRSEAPEHGYRPREQADEIAALARSLRVRSAVAIGHAGGAPATLELATRHPGLVKALVLIDWGPDLRPLEQRRQVGQLPVEGYEAALAERYEGFFSPTADRRKVRAWAAAAACTPRHVAMANREGSAATNHGALLSRVKQPALWINSTRRNAAELVHELLPHAELAQVVGAGHFPQLEVPEQVNAILRDFLARLDRGLVSPSPTATR